eukprot:gene32905-39793_t
MSSVPVRVPSRLAALWRALAAIGGGYAFCWGFIALGVAGFYALGAYVVAVLTTKFGMNFWLAWPIAGEDLYHEGGFSNLPALLFYLLVPLCLLLGQLAPSLHPNPSNNTNTNNKNTDNNNNNSTSNSNADNTNNSTNNGDNGLAAAAPGDEEELRRVVDTCVGKAQHAVRSFVSFNHLQSATASDAAGGGVLMLMLEEIEALGAALQACPEHIAQPFLQPLVASVLATTALPLLQVLVSIARRLDDLSADIYAPPAADWSAMPADMAGQLAGLDEVLRLTLPRASAGETPALYESYEETAELVRRSKMAEVGKMKKELEKLVQNVKTSLRGCV